jgi:hypothetical protein
MLQIEVEQCLRQPNIPSTPPIDLFFNSSKICKNFSEINSTGTNDSNFGESAKSYKRENKALRLLLTNRTTTSNAQARAANVVTQGKMEVGVNPAEVNGSNDQNGY